MTKRSRSHRGFKYEVDEAAGGGSIDSFTSSYIEAALWSTIDEAGEPLDKNYGPGDLAPATMAQIQRDCADFVRRCAKLLADSGIVDRRAGFCFWLSRNGHGSGFFDEDTIDREFRKKLQDAARTYGVFDLYGGDDGLIYAFGYEDAAVSERRRSPRARAPYARPPVVPSPLINRAAPRGGEAHEMHEGSSLQVISATNARPTDTGVERGVDIDVVIRMPSPNHWPGRLVEGEVTLLPSKDGAPRYVSWGEPSHWIDGRMLSVLSTLSRAKFKEALDRIEEAAADTAGWPPRVGH